VKRPINVVHNAIQMKGSTEASAEKIGLEVVCDRMRMIIGCLRSRSNGPGKLTLYDIQHNNA